MSKVKEETIESLPNLLKNVLGDRKIKYFEIKRLTAPGDNYASLMLKLDVTLKSRNDEKEEILHLVAKKIPVDELSKENFNVKVTFINEMAMYHTIIPILQNFQKENGVNDVITCFPKYYGARLNLNGSDVVDENAVLILENLVASGHKIIDRMEGFNLESTKLILKDLAELHAVALALKLKKPDTFNPLKKYCHNFDFGLVFHKVFSEISKEIIKENKKCADLVRKINFLTEIDNRRPEIKEPFATLVHYDLWSNNLMQQFNGAVAVKNKFVDFQLLSYGSPAADVFFFLWTSVQLSVLKKHFDDLLIHYHNHFIETLIQLHCDIKPFNFENFLEEMKRQCELFELGHALQFTLFILNASKDKQVDITAPLDINEIKNDVPLKAKQHVWYMLEECERRGWLGKN